MVFGNIFIVLCAGLVSLDCALSEQCTAPPKGPGQTFPDLMEITGGSYMLSTEMNHATNNATYYVTEYTDVKGRRSRVQIDSQGASHTILSFGETNELFSINEQQCLLISRAALLEALQKFTDMHLMDFDLVGPSNLLRAAYLAWKGDENIGVSPNYEVVRGMKCAVWTWCTKNMGTVKLYFTDPRSEHPYGLDDIPVPVRATEDTPEGVFHHEFFRLIPKVPSKTMDEVMLIPPTKGCNRTEGVRKAPSFATKDVYLEAEVIYTPFLNNDKRYTYVTNLKYLSHRESKLSAVHWTPWTTQKENKMVKPGDHLFKVFDSKTDLTYTLDRTKEECQMNRDQGFHFDLPDGTNLDNLNEDLLFFGDDSSSYHFLGQTSERGIPAAIFEKLEEKVEESKQRILTRYYMDDNALLDDQFQERNAPLKMIMWNVDEMSTNSQDFLGELVINVYGFQTHFRNVHKMFDVSACFPDEDQSKWFQLVFPLGDNSLSDIMPHVTHIRNDLPPLLQAYDKDHSPLRIPQIEVDIDAENVYATGLMLERPDFLLDFSAEMGRAFKQGAANTKARISTLKECAKSCLENAFCKYFSYCGAVCTFGTDENVNVKGDTEPKDYACGVYSSLYNGSKSFSVWTMDQLSSSFRALVDARGLKMTYFKPDGTPLDLIADKFKDNIASGRNGMDQKGDTNPDSWYSVFKSSSKLVNGWSEGSRTMNKVTLEKCKSACVSVPWCESVSYCLASGECILTPKYRDQITAGEIAENTQCMILSRNYVDRYSEFKGTVAVSEGEKGTEIATVEECAKACFQEKEFDCLSFDFCFYDKMKCVMHKKHYDSDTQAESQQLGVKEECIHYSRKIVHDFSLYRNKDMFKNVAGLHLDNVSPEECARMCRDERYLQPCAGFDHCSGQPDADSTCFLRKESKQDLTDNPYCNSYIWKK